jgi:acyl-CoA synthetase (AMP-forming)/AMP-acid ligase II
MSESSTSESAPTREQDARPQAPAGSEVLVPDANIATALAEMAARRPEAPAVREPVGRDRSGEIEYETWTYKDLDAEVDRLCHGLTRVGLERGMRTALMVPPSRDFFALAFALFRIGAVPVLIDPGIGRKLLRRCLDEASPEAFIGTAKAHLARILHDLAKGTVRLRVTVGRKGPWRGPTLARVRRLGEWGVPFPAPVTRADETAAILFTSGSTGPPKGAVYRHAIFPAQVELLRKAYRIEEGEVDLATFPLFALFDVALGMTAVIPIMDFMRPGTTDPGPLFDAMDRFAVRNVFASPALLASLARYGETSGRRLPSIGRVISAGAPVSAATLERVKLLLRAEVEVHTPYGATEALPVTTIGSDELSSTAERTRAGAGVCIGRPLPGVEVAVIPAMDEPIAKWNAALPLSPG